MRRAMMMLLVITMLGIGRLAEADDLSESMARAIDQQVRIVEGLDRYNASVLCRMVQVLQAELEKDSGDMRDLNTIRHVVRERGIDEDVVTWARRVLPDGELKGSFVVAWKGVGEYQVLRKYSDGDEGADQGRQQAEVREIVQRWRTILEKAWEDHPSAVEKVVRPENLAKFVLPMAQLMGAKASAIVNKSKVCQGY